MSGKLFIVLVLVLVLQTVVKAQPPTSFDPGNEQTEIYRSPVRKVLNKFSVGLSSGYGHSFYKYRGTLPTEPGADTLKYAYNGSGYNIPIVSTLHFNFLKRFRLGGGVGLEWHNLKWVTPPADPQRTLFFRYFGMAGARLWDYWSYSFCLDVQVGGVKYGKALQPGGNLFVNIGFPIEKNYSEYFRLFLRPSYEFKGYQVPGGERNMLRGLYLQFGVSINYPEIPRCKIKACKTQLKHVHKAKEFRGQPITKIQNPKVGENHPRLVRYKGKNKKRINGGY